MTRRVLFTALLAAGLALAAQASIPIQIAGLQCLQPVTCSYRIPSVAAADRAQEAIALEEALANAGLPDPIVTIRPGRADIQTYAASQADAERLEQLIRSELRVRYPDYRPAGRAKFAVTGHYAKRAMAAVVNRLRPGGYQEIQNGLKGPNRFWVSVHTQERDFTWAWEQRGLFEVRLWPTGFLGCLNQAPLVLSNRLPFQKANAWQIPDVPQSVVSFRPGPSAAARLKKITSQPGRWALAFLWDGRLIDTQRYGDAVTDLRVSPDIFRGEAGRREADRMAICLESGPLPTPVIEIPAGEEDKIPKSVTNFLQKIYPSWRLITYDDYGPGMRLGAFARLRRILRYRETEHPFAVQGDFDGNGKTDWAVLLKLGERVKLVALHHAGTTWKPHPISEMPYQAGFQSGVSGFSMYLEPVQAGQARRNWDLDGQVELPRDCFEVVFTGKASWLWLWNRRNYQRFVSGD